MTTNILSYLEQSAKSYPKKTAYADEKFEYSYERLLIDAKAIGTYIAIGCEALKPVVVFMKKCPYNIAAFMGVVYSRNFYVPVDTQMPKQRIELILHNLEPILIITDEENRENAEELKGTIPTVLFKDIVTTPENEALLELTRDRAMDTDLVYVLYTSGSTGVPKGVAVCHKSLIDYTEQFCNEVQITQKEVIANQAPFYFDASLIDIYCTLKAGGTMYIVPLGYFSIPLELLKFLQEYHITTIRWVPSALNIVSTFKALKNLRPEYLRKIIFGAEAMPTKCFNYWKGMYPEAMFVQIYGPTEITGVCTYYIVDREFKDEETIPIGKAFRNTEVFLLDEQDKLIIDERTGEICVKGTCLALGYYNAPDKTGEVFVQNPLNPYYRELIYRTGDLARYNELGELVFMSRKDYQIKHMGHRIELGEVEAAMNALDAIKSACCLFDHCKNKIVSFYVTDVGYLEDGDIINELKERLPRYMLPNILYKLEHIPLTISGKTDRVLLRETYITVTKK